MREYQYILTYSSTGQRESNETLTINPAGWNNIGVKFERNLTYMSVLRNLSTSLRFVKNGGGYEFILAAYESEGIYANIGLQIKKRNPATNDYDNFYSGILDMTPTRLIIERNYISVPIIDNRKLQLFKDRDELEINLLTDKTIGDSNVSAFSQDYSIELTPVDIYTNGEFNCGWFSRQAPITGDVTVLSWPASFPASSQPLTVTKNEIGSSFVPGTSEVIYTNSTADDVEVKVVVSADVRGEVEVLNSSGLTEYTIRLRSYVVAYDSGGVAQETNIPVDDNRVVPALTTQSFTMWTPYDATYELTIPANGGYLAIFNSWQGDGPNGTSANIFDQTSMDCKVELKTIGEPATDCSCLFAHEAFLRGLQILTDETDTSKILYSSIFGRTDSDFVAYDENGEYCYDAVFSGRQVRQYPDATLTVKFQDLFKHFRSLYNIGMGYDNENERFYVEKLETFFNASYFMFDLGEVADLSVTPLTEGYFNKITAGYDNEGDYEELQGAYEFAVKREYSTHTPVKEELNIRSKYRCDSVGIEFARKKQYEDSAAEDYRDDNAIFTVRTDGTNPVLDSTVTGFAGVEAYYNTMLTPRQNAIRHGNFIAATLFRTTGDLKAQSTNKLFELTVNGIDENSDIAQSELGESLIIPELYEFESYVNTTIINILLENPHGFIRFSNFGTTYEGYLMGLETGDYNKKAKYRLVGRTVIPTENKTFEDGENFDFEDSENYIFEY